MMSDRIQRVMAYVIGMIMVTAVAAAPTLAQRVDPSAERVFEVAANADSVDGFHAIRATANRTLRARKLVATNRYGQLPSNIIRPRWRELKGVPADFKDGMIAWDEVRNKPTVPGGSVAWADVTGKPPTLADGVVAWGEIHNPPAVLADRKVDWSEVQNMPGDFRDGVDHKGITTVQVESIRVEKTIPGYTEDWVIAKCRDGWTAVGGGFGAAFDVVEDSKPNTNSNDGWYVLIDNRSTEAVTAEVFVVCLRAFEGGSIL